MNSLKKNFSIVFGVQALILFVSVIKALVLPKMLSVASFGYWEVYWFYSTYCGLFCLGFNDGIYLKYGNFNYNQLPIKKIRSSARLFVIMLIIFSIICESFIIILSRNENIIFPLTFVVFDIVVLGISSLYIFIFQITNQFKKYGLFSVIDKIFVLISIIALFIMDENNYRYVIIADFTSKLLLLSSMLIKFKEILVGDVYSLKVSFCEMLDNMRVGIKLMIANLMGMLIMGSGKLMSQLIGNIEDFAIYSFGVSMTGLILTGVTAFSLVLYPTMKRIELISYPSYYYKIDGFTRLFGISSFLLYFPCVIIIKSFYSKYLPVLDYLNLLFVIVFLQSKIAILNNTFLKALRHERKMLIFNVSSIVFFIMILIIFYHINNSIIVIPICTSISMSYLYIISSIFLCHQMKIAKISKSIIEFLFLTIFIISTFCFSFPISACVVLLLYVIWYYLDYDTNRLIISSIFKM